MRHKAGSETQRRGALLRLAESLGGDGDTRWAVRPSLRCARDFDVITIAARGEPIAPRPRRASAGTTRVVCGSASASCAPRSSSIHNDRSISSRKLDSAIGCTSTCSEQRFKRKQSKATFTAFPDD
jgi:hypothetical protein